MVRQERRQDEISIKMFILLSGNSTWFHEGTSSMKANTTPHYRDEIKCRYSVRHVRRHHSFTRVSKWKVEVFRHIPRYVVGNLFGIQFGISHPIWTAGFCLLEIWTPLARLATAAQAHLWIGYMTSCRAQMLETPVCFCKSQVGWRKEPTIQQNNHKPNIIVNK